MGTGQDSLGAPRGRVWPTELARKWAAFCITMPISRGNRMSEEWVLYGGMSAWLHLGARKPWAHSGALQQGLGMQGLAWPLGPCHHQVRQPWALSLRREQGGPSVFRAAHLYQPPAAHLRLPTAQCQLGAQKPHRLNQ